VGALASSGDDPSARRRHAYDPQRITDSLAVARAGP
jgi:hypothetical protein